MNQIIANRYEFRRGLGQGGMGSVFQVYDTKLNKYWAVKECASLQDNEVNALMSLDSAYFPRIVDVVSEEASSCIIMDYVEGQTLTSYMRGHALSEQEIIRIATQIAEAMDYLHQQLPTMLYMDCKPDNIMLTANNEVRLVDLGSVYVCGSTSPQRISSTMAYASPEIIARGNHTPAPSDDIYSLGMTMYYMATGRHIEYRDRTGRLNIRWRNRNISPQLEYIIRKCTAPADRRYQSVRELSEELHSVRARRIFSLFHRFSMNGYIGYEILDYSCKISLCLAILLWAKCLELVAPALWCITMIFMVSVFLISCRYPRLNTVETRKNVFRGAGGRFLISLLSCLIGIGSYASAAPATATSDSLSASDGLVSSSVLEVQLYDDYGRNLLLKAGSELNPESNIHFSIPCTEIDPGISTIYISCESGDSIKSYSIRINNRNR